MSAYAPAPNAYRESAVLTATPEQLVVMLYDGAIRFLRQGAGAYRSSGSDRHSNQRRIVLQGVA